MSLPLFCNTSLNASAIAPPPEIIQLNFILYCGITPLFLVFGICGNILNLITLRSPTLSSVPFMYIRAIAVFDLTGLVLIVGASLRIGSLLPHIYPLAFYHAHVEMAVLNTFLTASLYTAVVLTIERYLMVCRPHRRVSSNPKRLAAVNIVLVWLLALLLHTPLAYQWRIKFEEGMGWKHVNNPDALCREPWATLFSWYERIREGVRLGGVLTMTVFNIIITKSLQSAKKKRRQMTLRSAKAATDRASHNAFAEKKLTALMAAITILYIVGNTPQAILMVIHEDMYESKYTHQVFRGLANLFEVLNHCLNFYVFCVASSDYSAAFLQHCDCLKRLCPCCASFLDSRLRKKSIPTNVTELSLSGVNSNRDKPASPNMAEISRPPEEDGLLSASSFVTLSFVMLLCESAQNVR